MDNAITSAEDSRVCIGLYGQRGTGKSSLINAILGFELLPTKKTVTATAIVTELQVWQITDKYQAQIMFISRNYFMSLFQQMTQNLRSDAIVELIEAVRSQSEEEAEEVEEEEEDDDQEAEAVRRSVGLPKKLWKLLGTTKKIACSDLYELKVLLAPYNVKSNNLWPLIAQVVIQGPFGKLSDFHVSLVDIPGSNCGRSAMAERARTALSTCDKLFYVCSYNQSGTRNTEDELHMLREKARMRKVGLISTKLNNYQGENRRLKDGSAAKVQRHFRREPVEWRFLKPGEVPRYLLEAVVDDTETLQPFVDTEIKQASIEHMRDQLNCLRLLLNYYINSLREQTKDVTLRALSDEELERRLESVEKDMHVIRHATEENSYLLLISLLPDVPESDFVARLKLMSSHDIQSAVHDGTALHDSSYFDALDNITWERLQPELECPVYQYHFRDIIAAVGSDAISTTVDYAQKKLKEKLALYLNEQKALLRLEVMNAVQESAKVFMIFHINDHEQIVEAIKANYAKSRDKFMAKMIPCFRAWHVETLKMYQWCIDQESRVIVSALRLRCRSPSVGHQLRHRLKELLAHIQDIPDDLDTLNDMVLADTPHVLVPEPASVYGPATMHKMDPYNLTPLSALELGNFRSTPHLCPGTVVILSNASFSKTNVHLVVYTTDTSSDAAQRRADFLTSRHHMRTPYQVKAKWLNVHYADLMTSLFMLLFKQHRLGSGDPDGRRKPRSTVWAPLVLIMPVMQAIDDYFKYVYTFLNPPAQNDNN
eukprot:TRINITY_DN516_c0_g1_i4.p1 TRINITY_DN516_c0_g1~~TRINITY_DN516_c0_g1_i4.p1  ORF type:complete len:768 (+),score=108.49 TRINITY_DN516_c0_g1_i4:1179-3482(+)